MYKKFQWVNLLIKDILALIFLNQNRVWVYKNYFLVDGLGLSAPIIYKFGVKECVSIIYLIKKEKIC
jgi:hypothetical protein